MVMKARSISHHLLLRYALTAEQQTLIQFLMLFIKHRNLFISLSWIIHQPFYIPGQARKHLGSPEVYASCFILRSVTHARNVHAFSKLDLDTYVL